jgi:hypothetical protein
MPESFEGKWRLTVMQKFSGFQQRFKILGASAGNGTYPGIVGTEVVVQGNNWTVTLEWNDGAGSGWQESGVLRSVGLPSPLVIYNVLWGDDNFPNQRDNDFDDLVIACADLDPVFSVVQRPFSLDRSTLTMPPDGIFDTSQGIQYMGVRVRNTWDFDWDPILGWPEMMIGIANSSRTALQSQGIKVIDAWTSQEQQALQQEVEGGFVKIPALEKGSERTVYFKLDVRNAGPSKPAIDFVAQRAGGAWDPAYDELSRRVPRQIFISRSTYNPLTRELVAEVPEGTTFMRLNHIIVDKAAMEKAMHDALVNPCKKDPPSPGTNPGSDTCGLDKDRLREELKDFLEALLSGKQVDVCKLRGLLECCCDNGGLDCNGKGDQNGDGSGDGPGSDNWCRFKPFPWIPVELEYRVVPNPAYVGQFGPLAFEDPWWKCILIALAILLAAASLIYDYIMAGEDPKFVIGHITNKSERTTSNIDATIARLNGSRGIDLNVLEAQNDDLNNELPINGVTGGSVMIDRSDNGNRGIEDAVLDNVVFKSGARSATTRGTVRSIAYDVSVDGINYTDQVLILPLPAPNNQPLSQGGDSGSLWIDLQSRRPVALNFGGPTNDDGSEGIANPIRAVVERFDIHFNM